MANSSKISESEWKIMKLLWKKSPQPAYDLSQELEISDEMNSQVVKTLLNRLVKKKVLGYQTYKNLYLYFPKVREEDCIQQESESFLNQIFDGSWASMVVHFAQNRKLSKQEIEDLKRIIREQESK